MRTILATHVIDEELCYFDAVVHQRPEELFRLAVFVNRSYTPWNFLALPNDSFKHCRTTLLGGYGFFAFDFTASKPEQPPGHQGGEASSVTVAQSTRWRVVRISEVGSYSFTSQLDRSSFSAERMRTDTQVMECTVYCGR